MRDIVTFRGHLNIAYAQWGPNRSRRKDNYNTTITNSLFYEFINSTAQTQEILTLVAPSTNKASEINTLYY